MTLAVPANIDVGNTVEVTIDGTVSNVPVNNGTFEITLGMQAALVDITGDDVVAALSMTPVTATDISANKLNAGGINHVVVTTSIVADTTVAWSGYNNSDPTNAEAGKAYLFEFELTAEAGYKFGAYFDNLTVLNAYDVETSFNSNRTVMTVSGLASIESVSDVVISELVLTKTTMPAHKTNPDVSKPTVDSTVPGGHTGEVTVSNVEWTTATGAAADNTIEAGDTLNAKFTLTAEAGYTFDAATLKVTLAGLSEVKVAPTRDPKTVIVTGQVTVAKAEVTAPVVTLDASDITTATKVSAKPATLGAPAGLNIVTVWKNPAGEVMSGDASFAAGACTVEITITLKEGYTWPTDFSAANVTATGVENFADAAVVNFADNTVTITATTNSISA